MNVLASFLIILILAAALVAGGVYAGIFYQSQYGETQFAPTADMWPTSKVVVQINLTGKVTKIDGKNLTIFNEGENLKVRVADNAAVNSLESRLEFSSIKVGSDLNILATVADDNQLQAYSIFVKSSK